MGLSSQLAPSAIARPGVCTSTTKPASPYEGQVIYTTDLDTLEIWNGTAWRILGLGTPSSGSVLQVVTSTYNTQVSTSTQNVYVDTGLTASITPKSSTSKILVMVSQNGLAKASGDAYIALRLLRSSTELIKFALSSGYTADTSANRVGSDALFYMDSPATTSSTTYKTQIANSGTAGTVYCQINSDASASSMVLMEVAG